MNQNQSPFNSSMPTLQPPRIKPPTQGQIRRLGPRIRTLALAIIRCGIAMLVVGLGIIALRLVVFAAVTISKALGV